MGDTPGVERRSDGRYRRSLDHSLAFRRLRSAEKEKKKEMRRHKLTSGSNSVSHPPGSRNTAAAAAPLLLLLLPPRLHHLLHPPRPRPPPGPAVRRNVERQAGGLYRGETRPRSVHFPENPPAELRWSTLVGSTVFQRTAARRISPGSLGVFSPLP